MHSTRNPAGVKPAIPILDGGAVNPRALGAAFGLRPFSVRAVLLCSGVPRYRHRAVNYVRPSDFAAALGMGGGR